MANEMDRVVPLDELDDFKVAEGDPDVRGWQVMASDGRKIGEVDQLLVDTAAMKVRYLDVDLESALLEGNEDRHVLVPIGYARLDRDDRRILVDSVASADFVEMPAYTHGPLTRDFETDVRTRFGGTTEPAVEEEFYAHEGYDEDRFYGRERTVDGEARVTLSEEELAVGKREMAAGEVEIDKDVVTEHVRKEVPITREEVTVERRPATGMSAEPRIEDDEIHIPLREEEAVVEKRVVPREELVVNKREVVEDEVVEADLRKERAEVHRDSAERRPNRDADGDGMI